MSHIQHSIAQQIEAMMPAHLRAGIDLGMERVGELSLRVVVHPWSATEPCREVVVRAVSGLERYDVRVVAEGAAPRELRRVTPHRLAALLFAEL